MTPEFTEELRKALDFVDKGFTPWNHEKEIFRKAATRLLTLLDGKDEKYAICEKKSHLPEYDGATGYFYYVPITGEGE